MERLGRVESVAANEGLQRKDSLKVNPSTHVHVVHRLIDGLSQGAVPVNGPLIITLVGRIGEPSDPDFLWLLHKSKSVVVGVAKLVEGEAQLSKLGGTGLASEDVESGTTETNLSTASMTDTDTTMNHTTETELSPLHQLVVGFLDTSDAL